MGYLHISARRTPETSGSSASRLPCMAPPCALPMAPQTMTNNWDYKDSVIGAACNPHKVQVRTRGLAHVRHNGTDISFLGDQHLRALVGRLCEAELRRNGLSPLAVTWGAPESADGSVDVRVASATVPPPGSAIVRRDVGYPVKAEDMPRGKILTEMRPNEALRASI
jgi:hypothetical protein